MNRTHPPRYPNRLRDEDYTAIDVVSGLIAVLGMAALTWVLFAMGAST